MTEKKRWHYYKCKDGLVFMYCGGVPADAHGNTTAIRTNGSFFRVSKDIFIDTIEVTKDEWLVANGLKE